MSAFEVLQQPPPNSAKDRKIFLFDIDNTLYRKSTGVGELMRDYIRAYIENTLHLSPKEAEDLHQGYYKHYGLAVEGLVKKNHIDAMDYNEKVDDALPLEHILKPDPRLQEMLSRIDRTKWKLWLCTNAYRNHGIRVVKLLGIEQFFEGITYCDYRKFPMICKPMHEFFITAMKDLEVDFSTGTPSPPIYFIDDSKMNVEAAEKLGWRAFHIEEPEANEGAAYTSTTPLLPALHAGGPKQLHYLLQLPLVCPELFE